MRMTSFGTVSLNEAWVTNKRNGLVSSSAPVNGAKLVVDCDRWRDDDEFAATIVVDDAFVFVSVFVFVEVAAFVPMPPTPAPLFSEWFNWFTFICVDEGVEFIVLLAIEFEVFGLEAVFSVEVETIAAVEAEELPPMPPPTPPRLVKNDADISSRSPGRKFGHAFGFNCNMLSKKKFLNEFKESLEKKSVSIKF